MNETRSHERRKHARFQLIRLVAYQRFDIERVTETIDVSRGGLKIRTEFALEKDDILEVAFTIDKKKFKSTARVVYCNAGQYQAYDVGLKFENTSAQDLALLNEYLFRQD